ncbi:GSCOCG00012174001-RA-CDS [Cotesia congregata]|nr:GSCOCG00012174001-RA-CDS [Cotesia congregata]
MVLAANQSISLNDALAFVPRFEGASEELIDFCKCCKEAKDILPNEAEPNLVKLIYGVKLHDKVKASLNYQVPETIANLTSSLKKTYVASKSLIQLQGELGQIFQGKGESVVDFANRLRKKTREITECHHADSVG